ncbi:hypothetical protein [Allohahella sp. A8]|uniref:hypothetical protein n=1 Tax=Allohahella sp. A8 TaxID=3141461 RepID=UPI003A809580
MTEQRKIYPVSVRPKKDGVYFVYEPHTGDIAELARYDADSGAWIDALKRRAFQPGFQPDYWEELPEFDERFVVTEKQ